MNAPIGVLHLVEKINALDCGALGCCIHVLVYFEIDSEISVECCSSFTSRSGKIVGSCFVNSVKNWFVKVFV